MNASVLRQFDDYLRRVAANAGIRPRGWPDLVQEVYAELLSAWGAERFAATFEQAAEQRIDRTLSRETEPGREFLRVVDRVKKRFQREKYVGPLALDLPEPDEGRSPDLPAEIADAVDACLTERERLVIRGALRRETPAETAARLGCRAKTVSNDKSRALAKLRAALGPAYAERLP